MIPETETEQFSQRRSTVCVKLARGEKYQRNRRVKQSAILTNLCTSRDVLDQSHTLAAAVGELQSPAQSAALARDKRTSQPRIFLVCCRPDFPVGERQEAIKEAPKQGAWRPTGLHGA